MEAKPNIQPETALHEEGRALGAFIIGRPVDVEFVNRYTAAHAHLFREPPARGDAAVLALAISRPLLLPFLAAASGLVRRESILHKKSLLMAAILEASPRYADEFLPRPTRPFRLAIILAWTGLVTAFQVAIGVPILLLVGKRS